MKIFRRFLIVSGGLVLTVLAFGVWRSVISTTIDLIDNKFVFSNSVDDSEKNVKAFRKNTKEAAKETIASQKTEKTVTVVENNINPSKELLTKQKNRQINNSNIIEDSSNIMEGLVSATSEEIKTPAVRSKIEDPFKEVVERPVVLKIKQSPIKLEGTNGLGGGETWYQDPRFTKSSKKIRDKGNPSSLRLKSRYHQESDGERN